MGFVEKNPNSIKLKENFISLETLKSDLPSAWNRFYDIHDNKFFKDRQWLFTEFPELLLSNTNPDQSKTLLEVGCGVGNCIFPIIRTNNLTQHSNIFLYCSDYSSTAIDILKQNTEYNTKYCHAFVYDITSLNPMPFEENSLDLILMIFVLSAIDPSQHDNVIKNLVKYLKPGQGKLLFRDYGLYDMAQLRFKNDKCIEKNHYARSDGTLTYFFQQSLTKFGFVFLNNLFLFKMNLINFLLEMVLSKNRISSIEDYKLIVRDN
jgi:SAM-dependent methyltransferase